MSLRRGRGLRRSAIHKSAHRVGAEFHPAIAAELKAGLKASGQLTPCQRIDQANTECCHACSAAACCWVACNAAGKPIFIPSQLLIASCTYADVRAAANPVGPLPPLQDTGSELADDAAALAKWGIAPMGPQQGGRFCDIPNDQTGVAFPEPDPGQLQVAGKDLIGGEYQIPADDNAPKLVAASIQAGIPVWLGTFVDTAFENLAATQVAQAPNEQDPSGGGHALYISGFRTASSGEFEFRVENSWGDSWCDNGACWASEAWLKAAWEIWPFCIVSKAT